MVVGNNDKVERMVVRGGGKIGKNQRKIWDTRCNTEISPVSLLTHSRITDTARWIIWHPTGVLVTTWPSKYKWWVYMGLHQPIYFGILFIQVFLQDESLITQPSHPCLALD